MCNKNWMKHFLTAYEEMFNWDASFYLVSLFLNNFPDQLLFTSSLFSNDRWNFTALFVDNSHVVLNNKPLMEVGIYFLASNKLQSTLHAVFTLVIYPLTFVASIECLDFTKLTGENTYCTNFQLSSSSLSIYYLYMEAASCRNLIPIFLNNNERSSRSTFS